MGRRGEYYGRGGRNALWDGKPYETPIVIGWGRVGYYGMGNHSAAEHPKHYGMGTSKVLWDGNLGGIMGWRPAEYYGVGIRGVLWDGDLRGIMGWGTTALRNPQSITGWRPAAYYGMVILGVLWDGDS